MSEYIKQCNAHVLERLKKMQKELEKMSPEELSKKIKCVNGDYKYYAILERFCLSGDSEINEKHIIIPKKDLEDGEYYMGSCRNSEYAIWAAKLNCFIYKRTKFGSSFPETIKHPEDDDGYDLFLPFRHLSARKEIPEHCRVTRKDLLSLTGECPFLFFSQETALEVTPEMVEVLERSFPEEQYGDILWFEGWPLRNLFLHAMVMGAWIERNKKNS